MNTLRKTVLSILLSFMCLFTSVGYAAVSGSLTIHGSAEAEPPVAVFITSVADGGSLAGGSATVNNSREPWQIFPSHLETIRRPQKP